MVFGRRGFTVLSLLVLAALGYLLPGGMYQQWGLLLVAFVATGYWLFKYLSRNQIVIAAIGATFLLFITMLFYSKGNHTPLVYEKITLGTIYLDRLFNASISSMIGNVGWSSTGINGLVYFKYHWFSHAIYGGLSDLIGMSRLDFYGIGFSSIFIPLFFKSIFKCSLALNRIKGFGPLSPYFILVLLMFLYASNFFGGSGFGSGMPLLSESLTLSLIIAFSYLGILLSYLSMEKSVSTTFIMFSVFVCALVMFTKISVGLILIGSLGYASLSTRLSKTSWLLLVLGGAAVAVLTYAFIYPIDRAEMPGTMIGRVLNFWAIQNGFMSYMLGLVLLVAIVVANSTERTIAGVLATIKSRKYIDLEALGIAALIGLVGGAFSSQWSPDVFNFCMIHVYLAIPILIVYGGNWFNQLGLSVNLKMGIYVTVFTLSLLSRPDTLYAIKDIQETKTAALSLNQDQLLVKQLLLDLQTIEPDSESIIYIPDSEDWFYNSNKFKFYHEVTASFIVPTITGVPMIGGIPYESYTTDNYYSVFYFKQNGRKSIKDEADARKTASLWGFTELIVYKEEGGKLVRQSNDL